MRAGVQEMEVSFAFLNLPSVKGNALGIALSSGGRLRWNQSCSQTAYSERTDSRFRSRRYVSGLNHLV